MTIDSAIRDLIYLKGCGIFPFNYETDGKQLTIATDECVVVAINTMRKYQQFQADYETRLKADMVAMLTDLQLEIEEIVKEEELIDKKWAIGLHYSEKIIQQKINTLKTESEKV